MINKPSIIGMSSLDRHHMNLLKETKKSILIDILESLKGLDEGEEIYFHDSIHSAVDKHCPMNRSAVLRLIDWADNEQHIEDCIIDKSSIDRTLITMGFECLRMKIFDDDFFADYLQGTLNNEILHNADIKKVKLQIVRYMRSEGMTGVPQIEESKNEAYIVAPEVNAEDFLDSKLMYDPAQIVELPEGIKVLTSNREINENAIVFEKQKPEAIKITQYNPNSTHAGALPITLRQSPGMCIYRVYLMNPSEGQSVHSLIKKKIKSIEEGNYSLNPKLYIGDGETVRKWEDKDKFLLHIRVKAEELVTVSINLIEKENESKRS